MKTLGYLHAYRYPFIHAVAEVNGNVYSINSKRQMKQFLFENNVKLVLNITGKKIKIYELERK